MARRKTVRNKKKTSGSYPSLKKKSLFLNCLAATVIYECKIFIPSITECRNERYSENVLKIFLRSTFG